MATKKTNQRRRTVTRKTTTTKSKVTKEQVPVAESVVEESKKEEVVEAKEPEKQPEDKASAAEPNVEESVEKTAAEEQELEEAAESTKEEDQGQSVVDQEVAAFVKAIEDYENGMVQGALNGPEDGIRKQYAIYSTIRNALRLDGEMFTKVWNAILDKFAKDEKKVLNETSIHRFMDHWMWGMEQAKARAYLLDIVINTCHPETREVNKGLINWSIVFKNQMFDDKAKQNLISFYKLQ